MAESGPCGVSRRRAEVFTELQRVGASAAFGLPLSQYAAELAEGFGPTSALNCTATGILEAGSYPVLVAAQFGQALDAGRPHSHTTGSSRMPSGMFSP